MWFISPWCSTLGVVKLNAKLKAIKIKRRLDCFNSHFISFIKQSAFFFCIEHRHTWSKRSLCKSKDINHWDKLIHDFCENSSVPRYANEKQKIRATYIPNAPSALETSKMTRASWISVSNAKNGTSSFWQSLSWDRAYMVKIKVCVTNGMDKLCSLLLHTLYTTLFF